MQSTFQSQAVKTNYAENQFGLCHEKYRPILGLVSGKSLSDGAWVGLIERRIRKTKQRPAKPICYRMPIPFSSCLPTPKEGFYSPKASTCVPGAACLDPGRRNRFRALLMTHELSTVFTKHKYNYCQHIENIIIICIQTWKRSSCWRIFYGSDNFSYTSRTCATLNSMYVNENHVSAIALKCLYVSEWSNWNVRVVIKTMPIIFVDAIGHEELWIWNKRKATRPVELF